MNRNNAFWIASFSLGFWLSFTVLGVPIGLGLFVFINSLLLALWYFGKQNENALELKPTEESRIFLQLISFFYVVLSLPYLFRLDIDIINTLIATHVILLLLGAWFFALPSMLHIVDVFMLLFAPVVGAALWIAESFKSIIVLFKDKSNIVKTLFKLVLYVTVSIFIFVIFAKYLSDADPEFKKRIDMILESLQLSEVAWRAILGVIITFIISGLLSVIGSNSVLNTFGINKEKALKYWDKVFKTVFSRISDSLLPNIITVPILLMFGLYVWVQFKYLFGQDIESILGNYTLSEYARKGFVELLTVGVLSYPLLSWSMNRAKSKWAPARYITFLVNSIVVSFLGIMLYSLILRMNIYTEAYGPSLLRTYVVVGAVFVGIGLTLYELLALFKAYIPGFRVFKGKLIGDYTIIAIVTTLSLLSAISLFPWSIYEVGEIEAHYDSTGSIDMYQLMSLPKEAQAQVYALADRLEKEEKVIAATHLKVKAIDVREKYSKTRKESLFSNMFGFNIGGHVLLSGIPEDKDKVFEKQLKSLTEQRKNQLVAGYMNALRNNDFDSARSYFDPKMVGNDIQAFVNTTRIASYENVVPTIDSIDTYPSYPRYDIGSRYYYSRNLDRDVDIKIARSSTLPKQIAIVNGHNVYAAHKEAISNLRITLKFNYRDAKLYIVDSDLILSYLPDAVGKDVPNLREFGYRRYCSEPTLTMLFTSNNECGNSYYGAPKMAGFDKSDFITKGKDKEK